MPDRMLYADPSRGRDTLDVNPVPELARQPGKLKAEGARQPATVLSAGDPHKGRLALHRETSRRSFGSSVRGSNLSGEAGTSRMETIETGDRAATPVTALCSADLVARDGAATDQRLLRQQREANEQLVLAAVRSQEGTDRAEALARRLAESKRELQDTAAFREQILGIVAHDLRNPLGAISMCGQVLAAHGKLDPEDSQLVARLLQSTQRMDRMIAQLFEFTRARIGGGIPLIPAPHDLSQSCQNAIGELALGSAVQVNYEAEGDLRGIWDGERLVELLSNIIGNAIDHAAPGTAVLVRARAEDSELVIEIHNQGPAIPEDLLPVLFVPFHPGWKRPNFKRGHLGLGLYISHEIARSHGGALTVQSGGGSTTFFVRLPRFPLSRSF